VPADSASESVKFTISIPRESCTNAKAKYSSSVVPPDPSVHFYHCSYDEKMVQVAHTITERRVPELIPVLGSQPACDVSHKPVGRLPLLSSRPAVTPATLKRAATSFAAW